jgi:hypothetical protein
MMLAAIFISFAIGCAMMLVTAAVAFGKIPGLEMGEPEGGRVRETVIAGGAVMMLALTVFFALLWPLAVLNAFVKR